MVRMDPNEALIRTMETVWFEQKQNPYGLKLAEIGSDSQSE